MRAVLGPTNVGWYACVIGFPLSWFYLDRTTLILSPYREGLTALLSAGNFLPLMLAAIASAWEGGRQSSSSLNIPTSVRSPLAIATLGVVPAVLTVGVSHLAATAIVLASRDATPPLPAASLYVGFLALLFGLAVASWYVGYFLTNVIAAPLMAMAVYLMAIAPSVTGHPEYRALVADRSGCCALDQQVEWQALVSPFLVAAGVACLAVAAASWLWNRKGLHPLAGLIGGAAMVIGLALPAQMNDPWATTARSAGELVCERSSQTGIEYCVWAEQEPQLEQVRAIGDASLRRWQSHDLVAVPERVSTARDARRQPGQLAIDVPPKATGGQIVLALAIGALPDPARCQGPAPEGFSYVALVIWLAVQGGAAIDDPAFSQFDGMGQVSPRDEVAAKRHMPVEEQAAWFERNLELLETCEDRLPQ